MPLKNAAESALITDISVYGVSNITELVGHLSQEQAEMVDPALLIKKAVPVNSTTEQQQHVDFKYVVGQVGVKRVLEIAAAGGHNVAMYGPPGTGKTMLAQAFCSILPLLSAEKQIETTMIHSCAGTLADPIITSPPLRAPHHLSLIHI